MIDFLLKVRTINYLYTRMDFGVLETSRLCLIATEVEPSICISALLPSRMFPSYVHRVYSSVLNIVTPMAAECACDKG